MTGTTSRNAPVPRPVVLVAAVVAFGAVGWWFVWPLIAIVVRGIGESARPVGTLAAEVFTSQRTRRIIGFTVTQAAVSTVVTMLLGLPLAGVLATVRMRGLGAVRALVLVPFVLPTVVVASGFVALAGPNGPLAFLHLVPSATAIVVAHVVFNLAVVVRVVGARWATLDPDLVGAARLLGAAPLRAWRSVTLRVLAPAIAAAGTVVFCFCLTSFGVIVVLGGVGRATVETEIYRLTTQELALDRAAVLVLVQFVAVVVVAAVAARLGRLDAALPIVDAASARRRPERFVARLGAATVAAIGAVLVAAPVLAVLTRGVAHLDAAVRFLRPGPPGAIDGVASVRASAMIALTAGAIALVVGFAASVVVVHGGRRLGRVADAVVALPLGVSAVSVGFGMLIALDTPVDLRGSWWIVPVAQAMVGVPFVVRIVVPAWRAIDPDRRAAAATLGASPAAVFCRVDLPELRRAIVGAGAMAVAVALGEFGATAFLARADAPTVPLAIVRLLGRPGAAPHDAALVLAAVLVVLTGTLALAADRLSAPRGTA